MVSEATIRLGIFIGLLVVFALWEALSPRRARALPRLKRWLPNFSIVVLNSLVLRGLFLAVGITAVALGALVEERGWGLFGTLAWPGWLEITLAVILLDMIIYGQHVAFHKIGPLWRIHRMHHADTEIDVSTGLRFHPLEIALSMLLKFGFIVLLGAGAVAVLIFEAVLNATSMFNHANIRLPGSLDRWLRALIVTPDMHRIHHSVHRSERDTNYGFNLSVWDRLYRTYTDQPRDGHENMTIGLPIFRGSQGRTVFGMLRVPFELGDPIERGGAEPL